MSEKIKIGSRGSKLALWQSEYVAAKLNKGGIKTEIIVINTKGDKILNKPISEIGSKGVFTQELENALMDQKINIAVHSAKDIQSSLNNNFQIIAYTKRELANDVIISFNKEIKWNNLIYGNYCIGTSSVRRRSFIKYYFKNCTLTEMRGNLQSRVRKLKEGKCDAMILAYAGVKRMCLENLITENLGLDFFVPPAGQGTIAIECLSSLSIDDIYMKMRELLNDPETQLCVDTERMFFKQFGGGCSIPVFCNAKITDNNNIELTCGIIDIDGKTMIKEIAKDDKTMHLQLAKELAEKIISNGGNEILRNIKKYI